MRKSIDGLCGEVSEYLGGEPTDGNLFVFYNRRRDKLKMLWWDRDGYWLFYKRLEAGTFEVPCEQQAQGGRWALSPQQLGLILAGVELRSVRMRKRYRLSA